jgi:peptidoglycan hydrolase CwlO-like protein
MKVFVILVCCLVSNVVSVQEKRSMESSQNGKSSPLLWMIINQLDRLETKMNKIQGKADTRQKQITEVNTRIDKIQDKIQKENSVLKAKISVLETEVRKFTG